MPANPTAQKTRMIESGAVLRDASGNNRPMVVHSPIEISVGLKRPLPREDEGKE